MPYPQVTFARVERLPRTIGNLDARSDTLAGSPSMLLVLIDAPSCFDLRQIRFNSQRLN